MKCLVYILLGLMSAQSILHAQILDNSDCTAFTDEPFFNTQFIKNNKIKSIHGKISTKKKLDIIRSRGLETHYEFDTDGKLDYQYRTLYKGGKIDDTTVISYIYDDEDRIIIKRLNDSYGFYSYNYEFDTTGHLVSEKYCREDNCGPSKEQFKLGKQYVIVSEKFSYDKPTDETLKRKYFNNYGRPYQEKTFTWDDKGYLIKEELRLLLNNKRNVIEYTYNDKGLVTEKKQTSNVTGNSTMSTKYSYDEVGNLTEVNEFRNGRHITKREIVYSDNMLLESVIVFDISSEFMTIIRYKFTFYE